MRFLTIFVLTIVFVVSVSMAQGQCQVTQGQVVISSFDESSFVPDPAINPNVMISYQHGDPDGSTSIRFEKNKKLANNDYPPDSVTVYGNRAIYGDTYQQRDRDLGQTFVVSEKSFKVSDLYLRVGANEVGANIPGSRVAIQFFKVTGKPILNDHGTPGFVGLYDRKNSPELDDYLEGESYTPIYLATGQLPNNLKKNQYMKWHLQGELQLQPNSNYAFMVMFLDLDQERSLSLSNNYYGNYYPKPIDNLYIGHSIRREGKSDFPEQWQDRWTMQPGTLGFPDVCTFRDLFFVITSV